MNNKWWVAVVILVVIGVGIYYWQKTPLSSGENIKIGAVLSLTGDASVDALNMQRGIELARGDLAAKGIVVDIQYQDDKTDPKQTVSAAQYLASTYQPQALLGPVWSFLADAIAPTIASQKIVTLSPAVTTEFVSARSPYLFLGGMKNELTRPILADWLKQHKVMRVAMVTDTSAWSQSLAKPFREAVKDAGAQMVLDEDVSLQADASTIASVWLKAKAAKADLVLRTGGASAETAYFVQKRAELNLPVPVISASASLYRDLLSRGSISADSLKDIYAIDAQLSPDFVAKFKAKYNQEPGNYADRGYDSLMIVVEAIRNAPSKDADALSQYLHTALHYQGYAGTYEFGEDGGVKGGVWMIQPIIK